MSHTEGFAETVRYSAGEVYQELSDRYPAYYPTPDAVTWDGPCGSVAKRLASRLRGGGWPSYVFDASIETAEEYLEHYYVVTRFGQRVIVADPTWQQFVEVDRTGLPPVLIGPRPVATQLARAAGVSESLLALWHRDATITQEPTVFPSKRLVTSTDQLDLL